MSAQGPSNPGQCHVNFAEGCHRYCGYMSCVHQIQMSLALPFTNVTIGGVGRRAGAEPPA